MEEKFYFCKTCGNLFFATLPSGIIPHCCGKTMTLLDPNKSEGSVEHHQPEVEIIGNNIVKVSVGKQPHPMTTDHAIKFISVRTDNSIIIRYLDISEKPEVVIQCDGIPRTVYAYCNIHGLWSKDL